jgi:hypothetical protein
LIKSLQFDTSPWLRWFDISVSALFDSLMNKIKLRRILRVPIISGLSILILVLSTGRAARAGQEAVELPSPSPTPKDENSHDLFSTETIYTLHSDFRDDNDKLGHGDSLYDDFSYDHRFLITGKWYLRLGAEYERFDFGGTDNGLPDHLQAAYAHLAYEYVVHDHAGASIELDPGVYFQDHVSGDAFDIPWKIFVSFPLKKDKIFGVIGLGGGLFQHPIVAPGGGLIWLFSDKLRLEGVFPKPALVYEANDDWQFRIQANLFYESFRTDDVFTTQKKIQLQNAVVQYNEDRIGVMAKYSGIKPFRIIVGAGYTFLREFDFFRASRRAKLDPAPYVQLSLEAKF